MTPNARPSDNSFRIAVWISIGLFALTLIVLGQQLRSYVEQGNQFWSIMLWTFGISIIIGSGFCWRNKYLRAHQDLEYENYVLGEQLAAAQRSINQIDSDLEAEVAKREELENALYQTREELNYQLAELQDLYERAQSQTEDIIEFAEEADIVKTELQRVNHNKDKLFSILAHDLRTPFTALIGYSELLSQMKDSLTKDQIAEYSEIINTSATGLHRLLEDLLEWSRAQMNKVTFSPEVVNLRLLVAEAVTLSEHTASTKGIELIDTTTDTGVLVDVHMIRTVLRNLISNAVKFTAQGGKVTLSIEDRDAGLSVIVQDTGVGMKEEQLAKLFQVAESNSTNGTAGETGTGLGLLLCKDFVERNGGKIEASSKQGEGSAFVFSVPRANLSPVG